MFCFSMGITKYLIKVVTESFSVKKKTRVQFYVIRHQPRTCNFTLPLQALGPIGYDCIKRYWKYQIKIYYVHFLPIYRPCLSSYYATFQIKDIWLHWLQAFIGKQTFSSPPLVQRHHLGGKWVNVLHWHSLSADCCFSELALCKSNSACWSSTKRTSSSSHWKLTCSRHDIAEKLLNWR
jgi:hypothetical protein